MALISLVYVSFANGEVSEEELKGILVKSRENNQKRNVTGMLLYRGGFFIQALEGEEDDVNAIYDVIKRDDRHRSLLVVYKTTIKSRSFNDWSMGFNVIDDETLKSLDGFNDFLDKPLTVDFFNKNPDHAMTLLNNFRGGSTL